MRHGCVYLLFVSFCAVIFVGVLMYVAEIVALVLAAAVLVLAVRRIVIGVRYAIRHDNPTERGKH
jgi:uncharacterized membrane protein